MLLPVLLCCAAGLPARTALGRAPSASFEDRLQTVCSRSTGIDEPPQALGAHGVKSSLKTVRVRFDGHPVLAVAVERVADGRVVVFLPSAPDPWSGSLVLVVHERVAGVTVEIGARQRRLKSIGRGSAESSNTTPTAAPAGWPSRRAC